MSEPPENPERPDERPRFEGLRPGGMSRGRVQPHERRILFKLIPIGVVIVLLYALAKPLWWPGWLTPAVTIALFAAGIAILASGLHQR